MTGNTGAVQDPGGVDVGDLGALATAYGLTGGQSWINGDFNQDANVDVGDLIDSGGFDRQVRRCRLIYRRRRDRLGRSREYLQASNYRSPPADETRTVRRRRASVRRSSSPVVLPTAN